MADSTTHNSQPPHHERETGKVHLVSGVTGLIGGMLAADLLLRGDTVLALTRGDDADPRTRANVCSALVGAGLSELAARQLSNTHRLKISRVDWSEIDGLLAQVVHESGLGPLDSVVHCAADMTYGRRHLYASHNQNLVASTELYESCTNHPELLSDRFRFYFLSTAYSCGLVDEPVEETLHLRARELPSVYHLSKNIAEKNLALAAQRPGAPSLTIVRPCAIVGHSKSGWFGDHAHGIAQALQIFCVGEFARAGQLHLSLDPDNLMAMVPIDVVTSWLVSLLDEANSTARRHFEIAHFTARRLVSTRTTMACLGQTFPVALGLDTPRTPLDTAVNRMARMGSLYTDNSWRFERQTLHSICAVAPEEDPFDITEALVNSGRWWREHKADAFVHALGRRMRLQIRALRMLGMLGMVSTRKASAAPI